MADESLTITTDIDPYDYDGLWKDFTREFWQDVLWVLLHIEIQGRGGENLWRDDGYDKELAQGVAHGYKETASALLNFGTLSDEQIASATQLTLRDIALLRQELQTAEH